MYTGRCRAVGPYIRKGPRPVSPGPANGGQACEVCFSRHAWRQKGCATYRSPSPVLPGLVAPALYASYQQGQGSGSWFIANSSLRVYDGDWNVRDEERHVTAEPESPRAAEPQE